MPMPIGHRLRFARGAAQLLALGTIASCSPQDSAPRRGGDTASFVPAPQIESDPIVAVGHGAAFLAKGGVVEKPAPEFIRGAQRYYIESLVEQATPEVRSEFERMRKGQTRSVSSEFADNHEAMRWLVERVKPADQASLRSINAYLLSKSGANAGRPTLDVSDQALVLPTTNSGAAYMQECVAAGVPRPPAWNSPEWKPRGKLTNTLLTQFSNLSTTVYTYEPPTGGGICFALPRTGPGNDKKTGVFNENLIHLLGIICQSKETSHACFWDAERITPPKPGEQFPIEEAFLAGATLTDVCTSCHRGENAFIVHPETPLAVGEDLLTPKGWMRPHVLSNWPQNPRPGHDFDLVKTPQGEGRCTTCHNKKDRRRLPPIDVNYCAVLNQAVSVDGTMPAATEEEAAANKLADQNLSDEEKQARAQQRFEERRKKYAAHIDFIAPLCDELRRENQDKLMRREAGIVDEPRFDPSGWKSFAAEATERALFGDFNGDGRSDYSYVDAENVIQVATANGSGFDAGKRRPYELPAGASVAAAGDFDGDGMDDFLIIPAGDDGEVLVGLAGSAELERWSAVVRAGSRVLVGDVNNDRLDDLVVVSPGPRATVEAHLSDKFSFQPAVSVALDTAADESVVLAGDVDGDYLLDLVFVSEDGTTATLAIGTGRDFGIRKLGGGLFGDLTPKQLHLADVDADGLNDLVAVAADGTFAVAKSSGKGFASTAWRGGVSGQQTLVADVNADGRADLVALGTSGLSVGLSKE
ncbi:MAG TPA: VCBS repeat-containing protein [Polyangiales bacterium]